MLGFNDIKKGKVITIEGEPYQVVSAEFLRKQQRKPVIRTVLKHLTTGQTKEHSFQQSDKVQEADIERRTYQFLFSEGDTYSFMDQKTYDQIELDAEAAKGVTQYLLEGQEVEILFFEGNSISVDLPIKIDRTVIEAPPGVKGDTSTNVTKDVIIEGGAKIKAPLFVKEGDRIRIDTRTSTYVERA